MRRLFLILLLFAMPVMASEGDECTVLKKKINEDIGELRYCYADEDCYLHNFGTPWSLVDCLPAIVSKTEGKTFRAVNQSIEIYDNKCRKTPRKPLKCGEIRKERIICLESVCRNLTEAMNPSGKPLKGDIAEPENFGYYE